VANHIRLLGTTPFPRLLQYRLVEALKIASSIFTIADMDMAGD
jgi:hypothetical protein